LMFNGNNGDALDDARTQWKTLSDQGFEAQYWSQESGNWAKKADNSKTA
jgi:DNA polymerase-3 subunit chi